MIVKDENIRSNRTITYLDVYLDQNLTFQAYTQENDMRNQNSLSIRDYFPENVRLLLLNAFVISHIYHPAILLKGLSENLNTTIEKQLN